jgi:hypothetical protein
VAATPDRPRLTWLAAAACALAVAGCAPLITQRSYAPGDGVRVEVGEQVRAENLMVVTGAEGDPGVLLGAVTNVGDTPTDVSLVVAGGTTLLALDPGQTALLGAPDAPQGSTVLLRDVEIPAVPAPPGAVTDVELSTPESGSVTVAVPVLDGTLSQYEDLLPTGGGQGPTTSTSL